MSRIHNPYIRDRISLVKWGFGIFGIYLLLILLVDTVGWYWLDIALAAILGFFIGRFWPLIKLFFRALVVMLEKKNSN